MYEPVIKIDKETYVEPIGQLKKVVDFLASADKETIRILSSFFAGEAKGTTDAKKFQKPLKVVNVYKDTIEVEVNKNYLWEEKTDLFKPAKENTDVVE